MTTYGLGIDTGGTYTDTVIVENDSGRILCSNKALTTRSDLSKGIKNSLLGLDKHLFKGIGLTVLSSTLATNSVVEDKGCRVGLICIGTDLPPTSRPEHYFRVEGRFGMDGREQIPLDTESLEKMLLSIRGKVDAMAIGGYLSVRNPTHEDHAARIATEILGVPTVCTHDLTSKLGFAQRTTTAVMNARLLPVIKELLDSVKTVLDDLGICSPLMVVRGDGSLMSADTARMKPVETILSGPASSLSGARSLAGIDNAAVVDIGGTTTDVGILHDGFPHIEPEGALLGGKRTRVMAADISTFGIGGDSRILVNGKQVLLSSTRAVPLCIAASEWPSIKGSLEKLSDITDDRAAENYPVEEILQDTEFFVLSHNHDRGSLDKTGLQLLEILEEGPSSLSAAASRIGVPAHSFPIAELERRGYVTRIGVTPTDLLHADGTYVRYDREASSIAVAYLARKCGLNEEQFLKDTEDLVARRIASCVMEKVILSESGNDVLTEFERELIDRVLCTSPGSYSVRFGIGFPLVGIGAPVRAWMPKVAELLGAELILPEHSEIGNAVGAVTGSVKETISMTIRASTSDLIPDPPCDVFTGKGVVHFCTASEAMEFARRKAMEMAVESARISGTRDPVTKETVKENRMQISDTKSFFRGAEITVMAVGRPESE